MSGKMIYNYLKNCDMIPDRQYLLMWGFNIDDLVKEDSGLYSRPVFKGLLQGLGSMFATNRKRIWERRFCIWAGDYGNRFWVGIPGRIYVKVWEHLGQYLQRVAGFEFFEMGTVPFIPLIPVFLYDYGRVCEYGSEDRVGKRYRDRIYDSGVVLEGRAWLPEGYLD